LPNVGKKLKRKESALTIESVKSTADVYAPVNGEISAVSIMPQRITLRSMEL
jgi:glycine cleavage system H lipoate-binding protein